MIMTTAYFFFSSRRRHTRYWRDWSSDVCSSDLEARVHAPRRRPDSAVALERPTARRRRRDVERRERDHLGALARRDAVQRAGRSEERRVGKECRSRWSLSHYKISFDLIYLSAHP